MLPHTFIWDMSLFLDLGSIPVTHTMDEFVLKEDLEKAAEPNASVVRRLLS